MEKRIIIFLLLLSAGVFSQAPQFLNYQGVARDASNNIVTNTIGLKFEILQGSTTGTVTYAETNSATPGSAGIFTSKIGAGTVTSPGTFPMIDWANGPYFIRVSIDPTGGSSYSVTGTSPLLSVPYALYAEKAGSGSSLPTGTLTGQTLFWNNVGNNWAVDKNILNNGSQVVVGESVINGNNKMRVATYNPSDSAALFVYHTNSTGNQTAIRGLASGSAVNSGTITINPIVGGHFIGINVNTNGSAVGAVGQGNSPGGDAIGVIAIGSSSSAAVGKSVGLYATSTGPVAFNNFAAVFDKGRVLINDSLLVGTSGSAGDVLTRGLNGRTYWAAGGAGPWQRTLIAGSQNVHLGNNNDLVNIGLPTAVSANEKLHVHNITGDAYINLSTSLSSNNVGLVFGESSNISKAFLAFDNNSNSLTYRHFGKRTFFMDGGSQNFFFGRIPIGAASTNAMNIYDSVTSASPRTMLRLVNTAGSAGSNPAAMFLGDDSNNGISIAYDKQGTTDHMHIGNPFVNTFYHTFTSTGEFYPGSNGSTAGLVNISGGSTNSADLGLNASTNGKIIFNIGHIKAVGAAPTLSVASLGTNLSSFSFVPALVGPSNNDTKGYMRATCTFSFVFQGYSTSSDELVYTVTFNKPYSIAPTVVVSPCNDILGLTYHTSILSGNSGFKVFVRNQSPSGVPVNSGHQFDFNYIVIE